MQNEGTSGTVNAKIVLYIEEILKTNNQKMKVT
jgi:hypothetical protein